MRTRLAYAARTLLGQVGGEAVGDPDGFGVHRTVMVSCLLPLYSIEADRRVRQLVVVDTALGRVALVEFFSGRRGDLDEPFDLG